MKHSFMCNLFIFLYCLLYKACTSPASPFTVVFLAYIYCSMHSSTKWKMHSANQVIHVIMSQWKLLTYVGLNFYWELKVQSLQFWKVWVSRCPAGVPSLATRGHSSPFMFILLLTPFPRIHCSVPCEMTGYSCFHLNHLGPAYISCFVYINVEEVLYCYTAFEFSLPCPLELFIFVGLFTWILPHFNKSCTLICNV